MGQRREPRKPVAVSVRIFGTDAVGKIFSEKVTTVDVSQKGVKLAGVRVRVNVEEIVGLTYGKNRIHFRVKWAGDPGSLKDGQMGLLNLTPDKPFWDFPLPSEALDDFRFVGKDRRQSARVKCSISAELHPGGPAHGPGQGFGFELGRLLYRNASCAASGHEVGTRIVVARNEGSVKWGGGEHFARIWDRSAI